MLIKQEYKSEPSSSNEEEHISEEIPNNDELDSDSLTTFKCLICNRVYYKTNLRKHLISEHTVNIKVIECEWCKTSFSDYNELEIHLDTCYRYICGTCGKSFKQKRFLQAHEKIHSDRPHKFKCADCNQSFRSNRLLREHVYKHTNEQPFKCSYCEQRFARRTTVKVHERIHTGETPYTCAHCNKGFKQRTNLVKHERIHTGEKPFSCSYCGKNFTIRASQIKHERFHHTGDMRFTCNVCGKILGRLDSFNRHMLTHSNVKEEMMQALVENHDI